MEQARLIEAEWDSAAENETLGEYLGEFRIFCHDRSGLLVDISKVFTERGINITAINSKTSKQGIATLEVSFHTKGRSELNSLIEKIRQIDSVIDIERTSG
jgi:GTP pyrophosphokinase